MSPHKHKRMDVNPQEIAAQIQLILLYGTFGLLMFGPLAFGAVEPWSIFIVEAGAVLLTLLWLAKQCMDGAITIHWNPLFFPMLAFAGLVIAQVVFRVTAYPHDTISEAALYAAYGMLCFLAVQTLRRSSQARGIAMILIGYGVAIALFAMLQGVAPN